MYLLERLVRQYDPFYTQLCNGLTAIQQKTLILVIAEGGTNLQSMRVVRERVNLQFRAESYNLFNRVQFGQPGNLTFDAGTFGQSTSEVKRPDLTTGARQIQFGMKLIF